MNDKDIWLSGLVNRRQPIEGTEDEHRLIEKLLDEVENLQSRETGQNYHLAAAFDLLVSAAYYGSVAHANWMYCPESKLGATLFYPYTNVCPSCALSNQFVFHKANKPQSGVIGAHTSRLLALFIQKMLQRRTTSVQIFRGVEPVDIILIDEGTSPTTVMFAEIKAAPLLTLPLMVRSQQLTVETEAGFENMAHHETDNAFLFDRNNEIFLPLHVEQEQWTEKSYPIGSKSNPQDKYWAYRGMTQLLGTDPDFLENYVKTWRVAFDSYARRNQDSIYWFTNACGQPFPRPENWPGRKGVGYESVSDGKTSVGMDRTDDLKKATYQVLKIGVEGRPVENYSLKVGVVSNIHAIRHFDDYFASLKDVVWTKDATGKVRFARQLPQDAELYNLFDGIVTLTQTIARDEWIEKTFGFMGQ